MKKIVAILDIIVDIGAFLSGCIIFLMILTISLETIRRYFWGLSMTGITELTEYGLLWFTMLGAAWVLRHDKHIRIDVIPALLKGKARIALELFVNLLCSAVVILVTYYCGKEVIKEYIKDSYMYSVLELPKYLIMLVLPLGFLMLFYEFLKHTITNAQRLINFKKT